MKGIGNFGAGERHQPDDGLSQGHRDAARDGLPRRQIGAGLGRDQHPGSSDGGKEDLGREAEARHFRQRLSAALDEAAQPPDRALSSGAESLAALFRPVTPQQRHGEEDTGSRAADPASGVPVADAALAETGRWGMRAALLGTGRDLGEARAAPDIAARGRRDAASDGPEPERPDERKLRLLAASDLASVPNLTWPPYMPPVFTTIALRSSEQHVERAVAMIAEAVRAELAAGASAPITIAVPMDPAADGLTGLAVTFTPQGLDVVLSPAAGVAASDILADAARDLVSRLQRRFPRSQVRVLDAEGPGPAGADRGPTDRIEKSARA